jgi:hypothetical protein
MDSVIIHSNDDRCRSLHFLADIGRYGSKRMVRG